MLGGEVVRVVRSNLVDLPTKVSLRYFWCSGFMISCFLVIQFISGVILSFIYVADASLRFSCVCDFTQDSLFVWVVRYFHIWGVTFIFFLFFVHMGRALYYSSYTKLGVWKVGFVLYILMMAEAFLGYILPWHQMSYWAATVITSIFQSVPVIGNYIFKFTVGGFGVTNVTLIRVFSAHVCLAFVILGLAVAHLFYLHKRGSKNPLFAPRGYSDVVLFHRYFTFKDSFMAILLLSFFCFFVLFCPDLFLDVESYIEADPMVTPVSIKPEWYFLAFYAMLRSVESKLGGMALALVFLVLLWLPTFNISAGYSVSRQFIFWWCASLFLLLTYLGACHPEYPYVEISKFSRFGLIFLLAAYKGLWVVPYSGGVPRLVSGI